MKKALLSLLSIALLLVWNTASAAVTVTDVTNGSEIRGVTTPADAAGFAKVAWDGSTFNLHGGFTGLSDPRWDDFYEGWLVRQSPFAFISTGELEKIDGEYHDFFNSSIDYREYDFYVLTLEPNDGNDAPADHILEWATTLVDASVFAKKAETSESDVVINLTGKNFEYSQDTIEVQKGDTVTVHFESTDGFHDWGVDEFDAWTERVETWGKTSVTFVADEAWSFEFYCSVGNHRAQGMLGWLIVKDDKEEAATTVTTTAVTTTHNDTGKEMTARQKEIAAAVEAKIGNFSASQKSALLTQVVNLQSRLSTLNISESRRSAYAEILEVLVYVLS